jgi:glyoxylase-like metal-dependent hydrolase (beta-lactamase superfamily II)
VIEKNSLPNVEILLKGYYSLCETSGRACSTITLVEDEGLRIVVDPGALSDPELLFRELEKRNLSAGDIDVVFITHAHMDHFKNLGLFPGAAVLDYWGRWQGDLWTKSTGEINKNIRAAATPGHSYDSVSLLVKTTGGTIAICGDVFWDSSFPEHPADDPFASDAELLAKSRKKLLEIADYIIPGHGDIFEVNSNSTFILK